MCVEIYLIGFIFANLAISKNSETKIPVKDGEDKCLLDDEKDGEEWHQI